MSTLATVACFLACFDFLLHEQAMIVTTRFQTRSSRQAMREFAEFRIDASAFRSQAC
jgi:hypothetical protein